MYVLQSRSGQSLLYLILTIVSESGNRKTKEDSERIRRLIVKVGII